MDFISIKVKTLHGQSERREEKIKKNKRPKNKTKQQNRREKI